jgi:hypothetical protein
VKTTFDDDELSQPREEHNLNLFKTHSHHSEKEYFQPAILTKNESAQPY